jgi:hypothetical protein
MNLYDGFYFVQYFGADKDTKGRARRNQAKNPREIQASS